MERNPVMRRLLVITYHFPPDGSIGGQRWAGLCKYLARLGWEIHVITMSPGASNSMPWIHRHVPARRRTFNDVYKKVVKRFRHEPASDSAPAAEALPGARRSGLEGLLVDARRILADAMVLPDRARGWVTRAGAAGRSLLAERRFDAVITSGPPHSIYFSGLLATLGGDVPFWIDMRDPWSMTHEMHLPVDRVISAERAFLKGLEGFILPRAAKVLVNTREFASVLKTQQPGVDIVHFPNGIDLEALPPRPPHDVTPCSIAYVGTLYANRNLSSVFAAIAAILRDRPDAVGRLRLEVAGPLESPHRERMHDEIAAAGLQSVVKIHGLIPRESALELLRKSHLALVLAQDQPLCVPAKIYESVGLGVPTLVIAETASAAAREAQRIGAIALEDGDVEGMRVVIEDLLAARIPITIEAKAPISYEELAVQMDRLLRSATKKTTP
jgi:glycosyltransferase involved in cell wall biosynthesis